MNDLLDAIARPTRESAQGSLFDLEPDWREHWWGMPEFSMKDATPQHRITINFMTHEDVTEFSDLTGLCVTTSSDSAWFPRQAPLNGSVLWDGPPSQSKYPICIPSKGRADSEIALMQKGD